MSCWYHNYNRSTPPRPNHIPLTLNHYFPPATASFSIEITAKSPNSPTLSEIYPRKNSPDATYFKSIFDSLEIVSGRELYFRTNHDDSTKSVVFDVFQTRDCIYRPVSLTVRLGDGRRIREVPGRDMFRDSLLMRRDDRLKRALDAAYFRLSLYGLRIALRKRENLFWGPELFHDESLTRKCSEKFQTRVRAVGYDGVCWRLGDVLSVVFVATVGLCGAFVVFLGELWKGLCVDRNLLNVMEEIEL